MPSSYPWYAVVTGCPLEQGDIFLNCPILKPVFAPSSANVSDALDARLVFYDVIVMTQSCNLAHDGKVDDVVLCPHWSRDDAINMDSALGKKGALESIRKGNRPRYHLLAQSDESGLSSDIRIVDFGLVFSLPKAFLGQFAEETGSRLRLCPPYREQLSQGFARYFMRVGLPQDIALPG
ncbi:MAG: hypothetical protein M1434_06990 [Chloroflexi bacterium]|nr:hypothetical protein [Chloroflexota bacterium]MCL5274476.1 hypothetical protein [Chloroflexota bacterium]